MASRRRWGRCCSRGPGDWRTRTRRDRRRDRSTASSPAWTRGRRRSRWRGCLPVPLVALSGSSATLPLREWRWAGRLARVVVLGAICWAAAAGCVQLFGDGGAVYGQLHVAVAAQRRSMAGGCRTGLPLQGPQIWPSALRLPLTRISICSARPLLTSTCPSVSRAWRGKPDLHFVGSRLSRQCSSGSRGPFSILGRCTWRCFSCCSVSTSSSRNSFRQVLASM